MQIPKGAGGLVFGAEARRPRFLVYEAEAVSVKITRFGAEHRCIVTFGAGFPKDNVGKRCFGIDSASRIYHVNGITE